MAVLEGKTADGKPLFGIMDAEKYREFPDRSSFPWLLELHIAMQQASEDGLPAGDELETLDNLQEQIVAGLSQVTTVHNIAHLTGDGLREVYCYLPEPEVAHAFLTGLTRATQVREFQYRITKDPTWALAAEWGL